ncbi:MAG TPA: CBS domain-containing protein [Myxococcota bacterium]|nr:CBS domain-containing protein [Myxococcota bacterium]
MSDPAQRPVSALMRRDFVSIGPADSLLEADRIMRLARIRHLPVLEKGRLAGMLSHRDVLYASLSKLESAGPRERLEYLRAIPVRDAMQREVVTAEESMTLGEAARRMLGRKIGCLVVVRPNATGLEAIALLTESDLLRAAYAPDYRGASD